MNFLIKKAVPFLGLVLISSISLAQEQLTNKEIINLQTAKVSQDVILAKISSSKSSFDLTAQGLIELDAAKISDRVIKAMFVASPPMEVMMNQDVIKISESEVSTDILKEKISKTPHKFEVDSESLIKLKTAKVSDSIVKEMILNPIQLRVQPSTAPSSMINTEGGELVITKVLADVKHLRLLGQIPTSASSITGNKEKLTVRAYDKLKAKALEMGASHVYIKTEFYDGIPTPSVFLIGVAYKK